MPIEANRLDDGPEAAFEFGEGTQPHRILHFLSRHAELAFTQTEIHEETGINRSSVGVVLSRLEDRGLVEHKGKYWTIGEDDRLAAYATQQAASSASVTDDYNGESPSLTYSRGAVVKGPISSGQARFVRGSS